MPPKIVGVSIDFESSHIEQQGRHIDARTNFSADPMRAHHRCCASWPKCAHSVHIKLVWHWWFSRAQCLVVGLVVQQYGYRRPVPPRPLLRGGDRRNAEKNHARYDRIHAFTTTSCIAGIVRRHVLGLGGEFWTARLWGRISASWQWSPSVPLSATLTSYGCDLTPSWYWDRLCHSRIHEVYTQKSSSLLSLQVTLNTLGLIQ